MPSAADARTGIPSDHEYAENVLVFPMTEEEPLENVLPCPLTEPSLENVLTYPLKKEQQLVLPACTQKAETLEKVPVSPLTS